MAQLLAEDRAVPFAESGLLADVLEVKVLDDCKLDVETPEKVVTPEEVVETIPLVPLTTDGLVGLVDRLGVDCKVEIRVLEEVETSPLVVLAKVPPPKADSWHTATSGKTSRSCRASDHILLYSEDCNE